jgi:GNAT superfamily N-acetyltransferase
LLTEWWSSTKIITKGRIWQADELPGFVAILNEQPVGLLTFRLEGDEMEIISLNALITGSGIGKRLLQEALSFAQANKLSRIWLITTNDNTDALKFYQKQRFILTAIYLNAIENSRRLKPEIAQTGMYGIPIRDEIELEMKL